MEVVLLDLLLLLCIDSCVYLYTTNNMDNNLYPGLWFTV